MRLTFIREDNLVIVDGTAIKGDYSLKHFKLEDVWAIQVYYKEVNFEMVPELTEKIKEQIDKYAKDEVENLYAQWKVLFDAQEAERIEAERVAGLTIEEKLAEGIISQEEYNALFNAEIIAQIREIENTDQYKRKVRLAMTGDEIAKQWLVEKETEIQVLRDGLV